MGDVSGDPDRTSFELQLNSDVAIWLAGAPLADAQRTVGGRSAYGRRTLSGRLADGRAVVTSS